MTSELISLNRGTTTCTHGASKRFGRLVVPTATAREWAADTTYLLQGWAVLADIWNRHFSDKRCRLRWSTQHWLAVYSQEFRSLRFFWGVDSSAARPGRVALANGQTGRFLAGSIAATGDSCFRWCRVARDFADHRSRPAHPSLP